MNFLYEGICQLIESVYAVCGDYGIAIVLITVTIRLCMIPLNRKQRKSMKKQQMISVKSEEIKRKYKNNQVIMNAELEKLYREEGTESMGCLILFLQLPVMIILYNGIRLSAAVNETTVLLPWIPSLMERDSTFILPAVTVMVQMFPQVLPYIGFFKSLNLQKMSVPMILVFLFSNSWFAVMLPAGLGLYYMVSGLVTAGEQIGGYIGELRGIGAGGASF